MSRKYSVNEFYFDKIDSNEKAYVLGFIYADGGIARINNVGYRLDISQHKNGRDVLRLIKKQLKYTGPILYDQQTGAGFTRDRLQICSKRLVEGLATQGVFPNKSLSQKPPAGLQKRFVGSFLRGLLDGDGSVGLYKYTTYSRPGIYFNGTVELMNWVADKLYLQHRPYKKCNIARLEIGKQAEVLSTIKIMSTSPFGMKRKSIIMKKLAAFCEQSEMKTRISKKLRKRCGQLSKRQSTKRSRD